MSPSSTVIVTCKYDNGHNRNPHNNNNNNNNINNKSNNCDKNNNTMMMINIEGRVAPGGGSGAAG